VQSLLEQSHPSLHSSAATAETVTSLRHIVSYKIGTLISLHFPGAQNLRCGYSLSIRAHAKGNDMPEPTFKFSVTCPDCALESLSEMPIAVIASGLLSGKSLRLYSNCHDRYWTATYTEREQLRKSLAVLNIDVQAKRNSQRAEQLEAAR
jgi:hypothetical protein